MNTWDNLPNAKHIDRVLEAFKKNPASWVAAWDEAAADVAAWNAAWHTAGYAAWHAVSEAVSDAASDAARNAVWHAVRHAARHVEAARHAARHAAKGAVLALVAYDDCAYLLDMPSDQVKILASLGMPAAVLLYPACLVFENE